MNQSRLFKCYDPRFFAMCMVAVVVMIGAAFLARSFEPGSAPRVALAALQALAMGSVVVGSVLVTRKLDELQQRIHSEALALAFAATGALISGYAFLERAGLPSIRWGLWAWPVMVALWAGGLLYVRRRYQ